MAEPPLKWTRLPLGIVVSGFASLGYQILWTKQLGAAFGLDHPALLAVLTAFMAGLAIGALTLQSTVHQCRHPIRWLAAFEFAIGAWAILTPWAIDTLANSIPLAPITQTGPLSFAILITTSLVVLPPTVLMGATLPLMQRSWTALSRGPDRIGLVYGLNTAGATIGVIAAAFWLIPSFGLQQSLVACCGLSIGAGILFRSIPPGQTAPRAPAANDPPPGNTDGPNLWLRAAALGFLGMSFQLVCVHLLSQTLENTVYTYAAILSVYLLGTSIGAILYRRSHRTPEVPTDPAFIRSTLAIAWMLTLSLFFYAVLPEIYQWATPSTALSQGRLLGAQIGAAAMALALPSLLMGWIFAWLLDRAVQRQTPLGRPLGANLLAAAMAPVLYTLILPSIGSKAFLLSISFGYCCLVPVHQWRRLWPAIAAWGVVCFLVPSQSEILGVTSSDEDESVTITESASATIGLVTETDGHRRLQINNRFQMGGSRAQVAELRQGHLPLLLHPAPQSVLFLGLGTGITASAALEHPDLEITGIELLPELLQTLDHFASWNQAATLRERAHLQAGDARRWIRHTSDTYDVIIGDVFHPARDGAGMLYTREHFQNIRRHLTRQGIFCQWLPLHQLNRASLRSVLRTFLDVFPHASGWLLQLNVNVPVMGLVGSDTPIPVNLNRTQKLAPDHPLRTALRAVQLDGAQRLWEMFLLDRSGLTEMTKGGTLNTDNHPVVTYWAPLRAASRSPSERLAEWLSISEKRLSAAPTVEDPPPNQLPFLVARNLYLRGKMEEKQGQLGTAIQTHLRSVATHEQFTASYARCIAIAAQLQSSDPDLAAWLLGNLVRLRPEETLAESMLSGLQRNPETAESP